MRGLARLVLLTIALVPLAGCGTPTSHPLVGKPAPKFTATMLDGQPFDLAQHVGSDVIVLDFWATWCGPCRQSLPTLADVAKEYRDRGVRVFAIDLGETPDEVRAFLEHENLDLTVVMDPDGKIGEQYRVEGIPQTVLIGRDGTVKRVHIGVSPSFRSELTSELNALIADQAVAAR